MEQPDYYPGSPSAYPDLLVPGPEGLPPLGPDTTSHWADLLREAKAEPTQPDVRADAGAWASAPVRPPL